MGRLEEMARTLGANVGESMGEGRSEGPVHGVPAAPSYAGVPARLQGVSKSKSAAEIPVDKIQPDPDQPREEFNPEALNRLAESLKARGQLQPIRVRWDEGRGTYVIVCGERRWRAAVKAGLPVMSCVVTEGPISPGDLLALQLIENCVREDLKPIEQARAFKALMEQNSWSGRRLADEVAVSHVSVVRALALLELPEVVQEQVEQGALPPATAYEVSKVEDPGERASLAARVVAERLTRGETVEVVRQAMGKGNKPAKGKGRGAAGKPRKITERVLRTAAGPRVTVEFKRGLDDALVVAALEEALGQAKSRLATEGQAAA